MQIPVEGATPAGKGEERQRHRDGHVDPHLAHRHLVAELASGGATAGEEGGAVAIGVGVDEGKRLIQAPHLETGQHGAEDLLPVDAHLGGHAAKQGRPHPVAHRVAGYVAKTAVQEALGSLGNPCLDKPLHPDFRLRADEGAIRRLGVVPDAGFHLGELGGELGNPLPGAPHEHRHADGHAALTGGADPGSHQVAEHLRLVGIRHDHHVVLGADKALSPLELVGGGAIDMGPDPGRAHETDCLDIGMGQQRIHLLGAAMHHRQNAPGGPRLGKQLGQAHGGERILLGGLEHEAVAAGHRQREHPQRDHGREVEGSDADADPEGLHPGVAIHPARHVAHGLPQGLAGDGAGLLHHLDAAPHIPLGIRQVLAGFLGQQGRQLVVMHFQQMLVVEHHPGPLGGRHLPPQQIGVVGGTYRVLDLGRGSLRHPRQQMLVRRVGHLYPLLACGRTRLATDVERQIPVLGVMLAHAPLLARGQAMAGHPGPATSMLLLHILFTPCAHLPG